MRRISGLVVFVLAACFLISGPGTYNVSAAASALSGKVVETMDSGGYTYVLLEKDGEKTWAAVPQMKVRKGQMLSLRPGMEMENFTSKTLNRTFKKIIFSSGPAN
jgi:hypothetical protein